MIPWPKPRTRIHGSPPKAPAPTSFSRLQGATTELSGALEWVRLIASAPRLMTAPAGNGGPVMLVPGFMTHELVMAPLCAYLSSLGHDARGWGRGTNTGVVERDVVETLPVLRQRAELAGRPVALVGWSLGGVISRELAREAPELVDCVITYGTPVVGGPSYTVVADHYGPEVCARVAREAADRERSRPLRVPVTAVFTRFDGVVSWPACLDHTNPCVEHVEVRSTHVGMGLDPDVWWTVARALTESTQRKPAPTTPPL